MTASYNCRTLCLFSMSIFTPFPPQNRKAEERKKQEFEDAKKAIQAASRMKGKSGRDLFNQLVASNADLFLDDDDADDDCAYSAHALFHSHEPCRSCHSSRANVAKFRS